MSLQNQTDYYWMAKAVQLARKGRYTTSPNPSVGCVIVDNNNQCVGEGFHIQAGTPHAEIHALNQAGAKAEGATAYVTLEPCSHFGRTPPCALALTEAKVARVVIGMTDPNPQVSGNGIRILQEAGIKVTTDVMTDEAKALNPGFIKRMTTGKPFVRVKLGISLDGKIALENGVSQWITGPEARRDVQKYRAQSCVVLTGSGTVKADNPSLLVRASEFDDTGYPLDTLRQPVRVVVNGSNNLANDFALFNDGHPTYVAMVKSAINTTTRENTIQLSSESPHVDLSELIKALGNMQYNEVFVEAGPTLVGALFLAGEVDELICYQAPVILGDKGMSMVQLPNFTSLSQAIHLSLDTYSKIGSDLKLTYSVKTGTTQ